MDLLSWLRLPGLSVPLSVPLPEQPCLDLYLLSPCSFFVRIMGPSPSYEVEATVFYGLGRITLGILGFTSYPWVGVRGLGLMEGIFVLG